MPSIRRQFGEARCPDGTCAEAGLTRYSRARDRAIGGPVPQQIVDDEVHLEDAPFGLEPEDRERIRRRGRNGSRKVVTEPFPRCILGCSRPGAAATGQHRRYGRGDLRESERHTGAPHDRRELAARCREVRDVIVVLAWDRRHASDARRLDVDQDISFAAPRVDVGATADIRADRKQRHSQRGAEEHAAVTRDVAARQRLLRLREGDEGTGVAFGTIGCVVPDDEPMRLPGAAGIRGSGQTEQEHADESRGCEPLVPDHGPCPTESMRRRWDR